MKLIHDIENLPPEAIELFEAAGYIDAQSIFNNNISGITAELIKANKVLSIIEAEPNQEMVSEWLKPVEAQLGKSVSVDESPVFKPNTPIDIEDILDAPLAVPISEEFISKNEINIHEIPSANVRLLEKKQDPTHQIENQDLDTNENVISDQGQAESENKDPEIVNSPPALDMSRVIKMEVYKAKGSHVTPIAQAEDINHSKSASKETNKGVNPNSKFYVKGVFHKNAARFKSGCRWFIIFNLLILLSFTITPLVIYDKELYAWAVYAPLLAVLGVFIYITGTRGSSCPICNQKQFAPKRCLRHKNAHHWPIFGYMLPTALHALTFRWFRCIFCGTSVRLKK